MADIASMVNIACTHEPGIRAMTVPARDDLARLREEHPGWNFGTVWTTVNSGPDKRRIWASRSGVILSAWNAAELSRDIKREQAEDTTRGEETS
jgi:hypothetical protein